MTNFDSIYENLTMIGVDSYGEVSGLIAKTICRLPEEFHERVPEDVIFISVDDIYGLYHQYLLPITQKGEELHFIILSLSSIKDEEEKIYVIAHEIAHFILGHYMYNPETTEDWDIENEADSLVKQWGFAVPERRPSNGVATEICSVKNNAHKGVHR